MSAIHKLASACGAVRAGKILWTIAGSTLSAWIEASTPGQTMHYWK